MTLVRQVARCAVLGLGLLNGCSGSNSDTNAVGNAGSSSDASGGKTGKPSSTGNGGITAHTSTLIHSGGSVIGTGQSLTGGRNGTSTSSANGGTGTGGETVAGGASNSIPGSGAAPTTGGTTANYTHTTNTGGTLGSGGAQTTVNATTGGVVSVGGSINAGGTVSTGGSSGVGGSTATGGISSTGGSSTLSCTPTVVSAVVSGGKHTCVLTKAGAVKCWGDNSNGQLGDGTTTTRTTAVDVVGLQSDVIKISAGTLHTCALTKGGRALCWGANELGKLGDGTTTNRPTPAEVTDLQSGVADVVAGGSLTCALTTAGGVKCWGNNTEGELGDGTNVHHYTAQDVLGLTSGVDAIAVGARHACARLGNTLKCWGHNTSGQVGDGSGLERNSPVSVTGLTASITQVETRYYHSCAVTSTGSAHCWGANTWAELGDGTTDKKKLSPVDVVGHTSGVAQISTGYQSTCIVTTAGAVECWPTAVTELTENIASVSAGAYHTCALSITGQVYCWGSNDKGQLGDGTTTGRSKPMPACIP